MPRRLLLVHTSDVHLGRASTSATSERALAAVVDLALERHADALLVAGDVVDYNRVPDGTVAFLLAQLTRFGRHAFILPGNHDCYDATSIYRRAAWLDRSAHIHLINSPSGLGCVVPELDLEVWGRPVVHHRPEFRPLADMPTRTPGLWRIAMGHGHVPFPGEDERSSPIFPADIAAADCDYIALGHWDRQAEVSQGGVLAHYSGAPYGPRGLTSALTITLDPVAGVKVQCVPLGQLAA